jgi:hypothetical protein
MTVKLTALVPVALIASCLPGSSALAALGGAYASVAADRAHFAAQAVSVPAGAHTVHTLTLPSGGTVKEYTRPDGTVFAVTWRGRGRPDLRQLLGPWFDVMQADNAVRTGPPRRRPISVSRSNFILQSGGHSGAFWGKALLPGVAPAGFAAKDLQ